jgi:hypothetical protein
MATTNGSAERWRNNPFYVLDLTPECSRADVERAGQKLLGQLELGLASALSYATPFGPAERSPELVRTAMAALRDPSARIAHEVWAREPADDLGDIPSELPLEPWEGVMSTLRWRGL